MGKQTSPRDSGKIAGTPEFDGKHKKDGNSGSLMRDLIPLFEKAYKEGGRPNNWTPVELHREITAYFDYCYEKSLKPCKAGIRLYLGVSSSQFWEWETDKMGKYGTISEIIRHANAIMEMEYINRSEQYPTANLFLLKTKHGYVEKTTVDITNNTPVSSNEVDAVIKNLGFDSPNNANK